MGVPLKIFIAGGSGFIGRHLIKAFKSHGHEVYGLARDRVRGKILEELGCEPIIGNLLTTGPWERKIEKFDVAIGCTMPGKRGQPPAMQQVPELLKSHTDGCSILINAAMEGQIRGLLLTFGVLGYGEHGEDWVDETTPMAPLGYGRFIGAARDQLKHLAESKRLPATFMFPGWVYGNGGWFKEQLLPGLEQDQARLVGAGGNYISFVHAEDLAEAYVLAAEAHGYAPEQEYRPVTQMLNLVDDQPVTQKEWLSTVARALGKPLPGSISMEDCAKQAGDLWAESITCSTRVKNDRAKAALGWTLTHPTIKEGVPAALDTIRKER